MDRHNGQSKHFLPLETLLTLYNTMIYPYLTYCNIIWASTYPTRLKPILRTQKKLIRIITFANYTEISGSLFKSFKILNIFKLNTYLTAVFMYSYNHDKLPAFFDNIFKANESIHSYNTRSALKVHIEFRRVSLSQYRRHGVLCTGVRQVNHSEVYGKGSKTNAFIRIRLSRLFTTLAVKTKKNTIV